MSDNRVKKPKKTYLAHEFSLLADIVDECAQNLKKTCQSLETTPENISISVRAVFMAETKGDIVRDRLIQSFTSEKHPPVIQLDRVALMYSLDKIMNKCEHAARQIELAGEFYPSEEVPPLLEIVELVLQASSRVTDSIRTIFHSFDEAVEKVKDVEDLRDESRDKTFALTAKVLRNSATNYQRLFAIDKITHRVQQVAERAKQTADLINNMKLKYV